MRPYVYCLAVGVLLCFLGAFWCARKQQPDDRIVQEQDTEKPKAAPAPVTNPQVPIAVPSNSQEQRPQQAEGQPHSLPVLGTWQVNASSVKNGMTISWIGKLVFTKNIDSTTNECVWEVESSYSSGQIWYRGTFDPATRELKLEPFRLDNHKGEEIVPATFRATVSADGRRLLDGSWGSMGAGRWADRSCIPGVWTAEWKLGPP